MSILKNNWLRAGLAILTLVFGVFVVVGAMEKGKVEAETKEVPASTTYFYNGPSSSVDQHVEDPDSWDTTPEFSCGETTDIPCSLEVPANMSLEEYLDQLGSPATIRNEADAGRAF